MAALLALLVVASGGAYVVGRDSRTPAQVAAQARPPEPSLITAPLRLTRIHAPLVLRGTLTDSRPQTVGFPHLGADLPVVSQVNVHADAVVSVGSLLGAVAGRPIIVFRGSVPAYQTMSLGSSGIDVRELQHGLDAMGISTGADPAGVYGVGTAAAVTRLYEHYGFKPVTAPSPTSTKKSSSPSEPFATVQLGEVAFARTLPATIDKIARLGQQLASGEPFARLSSGELSITVEVSASTAALVRKGLSGRAISDISGEAISVRVATVGTALPSRKLLSGPQAAITLTPLDAAQASRLVGQSLAIHLVTGGAHREWVVPVAALVTTASGRSSITVIANGHETVLPVKPGALVQGAQVIHPEHGTLRVGYRVILGQTSR